MQHNGSLRVEFPDFFHPPADIEPFRPPHANIPSFALSMRPSSGCQYVPSCLYIRLCIFRHAIRRIIPIAMTENHPVMTGRPSRPVSRFQVQTVIGCHGPGFPPGIQPGSCSPEIRPAVLGFIIKVIDQIQLRLPVQGKTRKYPGEDRNPRNSR